MSVLLPLPQDIAGAPGAPLVLAINDRLRRIDTALTALQAAPVQTAGGTVVYGTHAQRLSRPIPADSTVYFETDRDTFYQAQANVWTWIGGRMEAPWASMPVDLTKADSGFTFYDDTDSFHIWRWNGTGWEWGPGNRASGEMAEFDADPGVGWHICDGSTGLTKYKADGTRVTGFTVPNRIATYTYSGSSWLGFPVPAGPLTITLNTPSATVPAGTGAAAGPFLTGASVASVTPASPPIDTFITLYYYRL